MRPRLVTLLLLLLSLTLLQSVYAVSDPQDSQGSKDPDLFTRMPGFHIYWADVKAFDRYEFPVSADKKETVEGKHTAVIYYANQGITLPGGLQVIRNYVNAVQAIGGQLLYEYEDGGRLYGIIKVANARKEIWAEVESAGTDQYSVRVVERQLMKQDVLANADALTSSIKATGRVAVYGIYFDTNKADLKAESDPALAEIVKMLKGDATLKLYMVGHTDNVGQFAHNVKLSQERATAVVQALVSKHGIAAARLTPFGVGPTAPVAANSNEDGRAKNRRVELVAQ